MSPLSRKADPLTVPCFLPLDKPANHPKFEIKFACSTREVCVTSLAELSEAESDFCVCNVP